MKKTIMLLLFCIAVVFSSCASQKEIQYYSERSNYITATGVVTHMKYNDKRDTLYLGFEQLSPAFSDCTFRITGKNLLDVQKKGIDQKLQTGEKIEFISAPRYFGDGYIMPIVGLTVDGEVLLEFEQGYVNWLEFIHS